MKIAICDNNKKDIQTLNTHLLRYINNDSIDATIFTFTSGEALLESSKKNDYQIIFMDIFMKEGELNGIEASENAKRINPDVSIILTTISEDFAIEGYKIAVYYIVKPVVASEVDFAMQKCQALIQLYAKKIEIIRDRVWTPIRLREIHFVEAQGRNCIIYLANEQIKTRTTITALFEKLGGHPFIRCHRSFIVNITHSCDINPNGLTMENNHFIPIGRKYVESTRKTFQQYVKEKIVRN